MGCHQNYLNLLAIILGNIINYENVTSKNSEKWYNTKHAEVPYESENVYENAVSNDSNANNVMYSDAVVNDMQSHLLPDLTMSSTVDSRSP